MKFKAVIFDMDGVLVDSEPLHVSIETAMIKELNIPLKKELYSKFAGTTSMSLWKTLIEEFHLDKNPKELSAESDRRFVDELLNTEQIQLFEGAREVLINLNKKGIPIALASSSSRMVVDAVIDRFNIRQYFNAVITGSDIQNSKPHPEIFLLAAKKLKVAPSDCIVIEDSPNGVKAAQLAGINCIGFASEKNQHDISCATWTIKSFREFDYELF